ncbi:hypothetical protein FRC07_014373 [Ceratobasidium sp. 392]|nr:hypothetical protein FRC07_014373 [Ceratobasidium sp. 392]
MQLQLARPNLNETRSVEDPTSQYLVAALLAREDCQVLKELNELRGMGWRSGIVHEHFTNQRHQADYNKHEGTDTFWANKMFQSMWHMDHMGRFVQAKRFLDIGCCPGGYSTYVMRMCPQATGMGISLPVEEGGHGIAIPTDMLPRIDLVMKDLMAYDLPANQLPFEPHTFDFVICDGHYLRLNPDNMRRPWNWTRLLVSQTLLGLRAVTLGGTMFIKLSHVERPLTARILLALCRISNHVRTVKSKVLHASRGSFYVLAQGIRTTSQEYKELVSGLERLWHILNFEGWQGCGREISWAEQDHVTPWTEAMSPRGVMCIVRLGTKMWQIQRDGLRELLKWKGVDTDNRDWRKREVVGGGYSEGVARN